MCTSFFIALEDDAAWDNWNNGTVVQVRVQGAADVLNSSYVLVNQQESDLFEEKQNLHVHYN